MRSQNKKVLCNVVLFIILVFLSAATVEYHHLHEALLTGKVVRVAETRHLFSVYPDELYSFVERQQAFLAGDGKHSCVTLSYYPLMDREDESAMGVNASQAPRTPAPLRATPQEAVRLRSSIIAKDYTLLQGPAGAISWRVHTERLGSSLLSSPRATSNTVTTAEPAFEFTTTTTTTTTTSTSTASPTDGSQESSSVSSDVHGNANHQAASIETTITSSLAPASAATAQQVAPRRANAVILLMSPTFSSETVPTSIHVDGTPPPAFADDADPQAPAEARPSTAFHPQTTTTADSPITASPVPWRCRRCQQFLEKLLPSLESEFLRRYSYPVHILHRGIMPSEVVQYITAVLASASRVTIEDISGVLTEKVTPTSALVLEPWLKEMGADLHYRRRFTTAAPVTAPPVVTPPNDGAATAVEGDVAAEGEGTPGTNGLGTLAPTLNAGGRERAAQAGPSANGNGAANLAGAGVGVTGGTTGGVSGGATTTANNNGGAAATGANNNNNNNNNDNTNPNNNNYSPSEESDNIVQVLREGWEQRRFWTGPLFLLSSLQMYDYFWYVDSQSYFLKPFARDVLADVVNYTCAVAYHKLSYLTHKRVTDLWSALMAWNEQSAQEYFTTGELERALAWLSDGQSEYGGKIYSSDTFIMSFAVTRHPAYLDFFHWIDSRPPYGLLKQLWNPLAVYTVFAELLMEKHGWDSCYLDPFSGYRSTLG